jgi:hypothetical protein
VGIARQSLVDSVAAHVLYTAAQRVNFAAIRRDCQAATGLQLRLVA